MLAVALLVAGAFLLRTGRQRAAAALAALIVTPALLVAELWDDPQVSHLRHHPAQLAGAIVGAAIVLLVLAALFHRRPEALPVLAVAALPFRLPVATTSAGGGSANLLVPLYAVIGGGVLAYAWRRLGPGSRAAAAAEGNGGGTLDEVWRERTPGRLELALLLFVVLYALQSLYSSDYEQGLKNAVFFYIPFTLLLKLLTTVQWSRKIVTACVAVTAALALAFVGVGFVEYATRHLLWNHKVIESNEFQSYFRVNSLFFDPNIFGRYIAMVMVVLAGLLLWASRRRDVLVTAAMLAVLWAGLVLSFSQSSFGALLLGLGVLAGFRWGWRPVVLAGVGAAVLALAVVVAAPGLVHLNYKSKHGVNRASSGRLDLIRGGAAMFADRPLWGYGSGSFAKRYRAREKASSQQAASASHTIPLTVAAEQGVLGFAAYVLVLVAAFGLLFAGLGRLGDRAPPARVLARVVVAAAFCGLVLHTLLYAAFLEDPITWTLLALGIVLSAPLPSPAPLSPAPSARTRIRTSSP
ncbi:MAG: O-antigen ligase family protein [Thermoleophilaceae bacterium]